MVSVKSLQNEKAKLNLKDIDLNVNLVLNPVLFHECSNVICVLIHRKGQINAQLTDYIHKHSYIHEICFAYFVNGNQVDWCKCWSFLNTPFMILLNKYRVFCHSFWKLWRSMTNNWPVTTTEVHNISLHNVGPLTIAVSLICVIDHFICVIDHFKDNMLFIYGHYMVIFVAITMAGKRVIGHQVSSFHWRMTDGIPLLSECYIWLHTKSKNCLYITC